jgi:signal recognition particle GTPase
VKRISRGAGVQEKDVKDLMKQYFAAKRMMKSRQGRRLMKMLRSQGIRPEDLMK